MRLVCFLFMLTFVAGTCLTALAQSPPAASRVGFSKVKPESRPFVRFDGEYLVPYEQQIPGTDITISMVPVPAGSFMLGSPDSEEDREEFEGPQIEVSVQAMWVAKTEVTWEQYFEYMKLHETFQYFSDLGERVVQDHNAADAVTAPTPLYDPTFTFEYGKEPNQPAVTMTQYAAKQFSKWLSGITGVQYRLPTEAEWEYAARGGTQSVYYWGDAMDQADEHAWYFDNSESAPESVGLKQPNPFGLHDMLGGVGEWTVNEFDPDGYAAYLDKQPAPAIQIVKWPSQEDAGVVRGGHWKSEPEELRCAAKLKADYAKWRLDDPNFPKSPWWCTNDPTRGIGFRLFRSARPLESETINKFWNATEERIDEVVEEKVADRRSYYGKADRSLPDAIKAMDP